MHTKIGKGPVAKQEFYDGAEGEVAGIDSLVAKECASSGESFIGQLLLLLVLTPRKVSQSVRQSALVQDPRKVRLLQSVQK